jgi:uncharacterized membrane protein
MGHSSTTPNKDLMTQAREALAGRWGLFIFIYLIWFAIQGWTIFMPAEIFWDDLFLLVIVGPWALGLASVVLSTSRYQEAQVSDAFSGFRDSRKFGVGLGAYLLMVLFIVLWALLLIIPGIIAALAYGMTFYILADDPSVGPRQAISRSKELMRGNKWKYFCLSMRFAGWGILLCGLPAFLVGFGLAYYTDLSDHMRGVATGLAIWPGILFVGPYFCVSVAGFYDDLVNQEQEQEEEESESAAEEEEESEPAAEE